MKETDKPVERASTIDPDGDLIFHFTAHGRSNNGEKTDVAQQLGGSSTTVER